MDCQVRQRPLSTHYSRSLRKRIDFATYENKIGTSDLRTKGFADVIV